MSIELSNIATTISIYHMYKTGHALSLQSIELTPEALQNADCVVLTTNHEIFDPKIISKYSNLILYLRNMIKDATNKIYKL